MCTAWGAGGCSEQPRIGRFQPCFCPHESTATAASPLSVYPPPPLPSPHCPQHIVSVPAINNCKDAIFLWIQNQGDLAGIRANIGTITNCKRAVVYAGAPAGANIM